MGIKVKTKGSFKNTEQYLETHQESAFTEQQIYQIADRALELFKKNTPSKLLTIILSFNTFYFLFIEWFLSIPIR